MRSTQASGWKFPTEWAYTIENTNQSRIDISYDSTNQSPSTLAGHPQSVKNMSTKMREGSESFEQVAHVAAGEGSPTDRSRFEETLRKCVAAVSIDVQQSVLIDTRKVRTPESLIS